MPGRASSRGLLAFPISLCESQAGRKNLEIRTKDSSFRVVKPCKDKRLMAGTKDDKSPTTEGLTGDPDVFEALIRQHQHMIHSLVIA